MLSRYNLSFLFMFALVKPDFVECTIKHGGLLKEDKLEDILYIYLSFSLSLFLSLRSIEILRSIDSLTYASDSTIAVWTRRVIATVV